MNSRLALVRLRRRAYMSFFEVERHELIRKGILEWNRRDRPGSGIANKTNGNPDIPQRQTNREG